MTILLITYIVWKQGTATTRIIDERSFPIKKNVGQDILPPYIEWVGKANTYDGRYSSMEYILVRGDLSPKALQYMQNFELLVKRADKWTLYKNRSNS